MDMEDALLLLAGAVIGGLAVYMLFFRSQSYTINYPEALVYRPAQRKEEVYSPVQRNEEIREFERDEKGFIKRSTIHRKVESL